MVVTDVVMPGMSGPELAERIGAAAHGPPVVFMSGYVGDDVLRLPEGDSVLIEKPFTAEDLIEGVRAALALARR